MGQQQLLLVVLGIIIIGIAIFAAFQIFRQQAIETKREVVTNECVHLASMAIDFYNKPKNYGGGGKTFVGWDIPEQLVVTASGNYRATIFTDSVIIIGTGNEVVTGTDSVRVKAIVSGNSFSTQVVN